MKYHNIVSDNTKLLLNMNHLIYFPNLKHKTLILGILAGVKSKDGVLEVISVQTLMR